MSKKVEITKDDIIGTENYLNDTIKGLWEVHKETQNSDVYSAARMLERIVRSKSLTRGLAKNYNES